MLRWFRRQRGLVALVIPLVSAALGGSAVAAAGTLGTGPGWTSAPASLLAGLSFSGTPTDVLVQGTHKGTGCVFPLQGSGGSRPRVDAEIAINPSTCQAVYREGVLTQLPSWVHPQSSTLNPQQSGSASYEVYDQWFACAPNCDAQNYDAVYGSYTYDNGIVTSVYNWANTLNGTDCTSPGPCNAFIDYGPYPFGPDGVGTSEAYLGQSVGWELLTYGWYDLSEELEFYGSGAWNYYDDAYNPDYPYVYNQLYIFN